MVCVDETGWKQAGEQRFLWGAFSEEAAALRVAPSRHREEAEALLGESEAVISSDRWWAYDHLDPARRQVCWSHLLRDFRYHAESPLADQSEFGAACLRIAEGVFDAWREFQASGDRHCLRRRVKPLQSELKALCEQGKRKSPKTRYHRGLARNLIKVWPALWTFTETDSVEPTNNRAERGLRHAVIYRKLSQGSRCERGARATERLLSAAITCRLQRRSLFAYLVEVAQASIRGHPTPGAAARPDLSHHSCACSGSGSGLITSSTSCCAPTRTRLNPAGKITRTSAPGSAALGTSRPSTAGRPRIRAASSGRVPAPAAHGDGRKIERLALRVRLAEVGPVEVSRR